jgi:hypothetical protein
MVIVEYRNLKMYTKGLIVYLQTKRHMEKCSEYEINTSVLELFHVQMDASKLNRHSAALQTCLKWCIYKLKTEYEWGWGWQVFVFINKTNYGVEPHILMT